MVYWGHGQKEYLDTNVNRFLAAAKLGRAWYIKLAEPETERARKQEWRPGDPETEVIVNEERHFRYEQLQPFLKRVRERARK